MNEPNPYQPPVELDAPPPIYDPGDPLGALDFKALKKLYHRSCNVNCFTALIGIGAVAILLVLLIRDTGIAESMSAVLFGVAAVYALAVVGLYRRTTWGRVLGIVIAAHTLINFPVGTIIGAFGLFAFIGAPQLFGRDRIRHREVKQRFKQHKADLKAGRLAG